MVPICILGIILLLVFDSEVSGQQFAKVRAEVTNRLLKLKPKSTSRIKYELIVPAKPRKLPENLTLDVVYKEGHYDFEYVVLRFEREQTQPFVKVTRFKYGSALRFWVKHSKKYSQGDRYIAERGQIAKREFDELLARSVLYFDSQINRIDKPRTYYDKRTKTWHGSGIEGSSLTVTSGDGSVTLRLCNSMSLADPILQGSGSLVGSVEARKDNGYDFLRENVFWEVYDDHLIISNIFSPIDDKEAEAIIIGRLSEPNMSNDYHDYYRQTALVEILGEIGTLKLIDPLNKVISNNGLEPDWNRYAAMAANEAIRKIYSRK